jgi:hypothetical protein
VEPTPISVDQPAARPGEGLTDRCHAGIAHALDQHVVGAVETAEHPRQVIGGDAAAGVRHLDQDEAAPILLLGAHLEGDLALHRGGRARVLEKVDQDLLQGLAVGVDGLERLGDVDPQGDVALAHLRAGVGHGIVDDQVQVDRLGLHGGQPGLDGGDLDEVLDQAADALGGGLDALDELALERAQDADRFAQQQVGVADDGRHRLAQLL